MNVSEETFNMYFQHGLPDKAARDRHWSGERYNDDFAVLGVSNPSLTDMDAALLHLPYLQPSRYLHRAKHPVEVGNIQPHEPLQEILEGTDYEDWDQTAAVARIGADIHDVMYMNIDADPFGRYALSDQVLQLIDGVADWGVRVAKRERLYEIFLTEKSRQAGQWLVRMAADLFEAPEGVVLNHKTGGGNEFGSSLAGMQFLKRYAIDDQNRPLKTVHAITIAAITAATIPFRPNATVNEHGVIKDGFMERLGRRVHKALLADGHDPKTAYRTTNAITAIATCVANRDIAPFTKPDNAAELTHGARLIRAEEIILDGRHALRESATTMSALTRMARMLHSAPGLYSLIMKGTIPPSNLGKFVVPFDEQGNLRGLEDSYPPQDVHAQATDYAKENVEVSNKSLALHQVGITIGRNLLRANGDLDTEVPGGVDTKVAIPSMAHRASHYAELVRGGGKPWLLYQIAEGKGQADVHGITQRSPLSAFTLAAIGLGEAMELSTLIQTHWGQALASGEADPYFDTERSEEFQSAMLERFSPQDYNKVIDILILAAKLHKDYDRAIALERLKVEE